MAEFDDFDLDYEFDAPRYYDFTKPETEWEKKEADLWFKCGDSDLLSPCAVKLNWWFELPKECLSPSPADTKTNNSLKSTSDCSRSVGSEAATVDESNKGSETHSQPVQAIPRTTPKSQVQSSLLRSSTLMNPTASLLAKLKIPVEVLSNQYSRRCQRSLVKFSDVSSQNSSVSSLMQIQSTKRQKLDAGYLGKVSVLDPQILGVRKLPKTVGALHAKSANGGSKIRIDRELDLKTAESAQSHRSNVDAASGKDGKLCSSLKARPVNKKILNAVSQPVPRSAPRLPEFQVFHLRTMERAIHRATKTAKIFPAPASMSEKENMDSNMSVNALQGEKHKQVHRSKSCQTRNPATHPINSKISSKCYLRDVKVEQTWSMEARNVAIASR